MPIYGEPPPTLDEVVRWYLMKTEAWYISEDMRVPWSELRPGKFIPLGESGYSPHMRILLGET